MKHNHIITSALSLAIVGASVVSPLTYAFDEIDVYNDITEYLDTITGLGLISVLDNFYSYGYVGFQDSEGRLTRLSLCIDNISTRINGFNKIVEFHYRYPSSVNGVLTGSNTIALVNDTLSHYEYIDYGNVRYTFSGANQIVYFDMPNYYYPNASSDSKSASVPASFTTKLSNPPVGNFASNINFVVEKYEPPTPTQPPYTTPAPAFPNLPDNWVNPDFDIPDINIPDFDVNIDIPDYTLPEQPTIESDVESAIGGIGSIIYKFIDDLGLMWLVAFGLFAWLLSEILGR